MWRRLHRSLSLLPGLYFGGHRSEEKMPTEEEEIETTISKVLLTSEHSEFSKLKIYAFDSQTLGREVTTHLDIGLGRHISSTFNDGERHIRLLQSVRGHSVFILKSFESQNINDGIMELMFAVSCIKNEGAKRVTAILPYLPYSTAAPTSTDVVEGRDFYTCFASDIVKMLEAMGCDQVITINSLISQPKGFAQTSCFVNIEAAELAVPYLVHAVLSDPVIIGSRLSMDTKHIGKLQKTFQRFAFDCKIGFFDNLTYIGENVQGKDVVLFSNLIRTGKTFCEQVRGLKAQGARRIYCYGFHVLCSSEQLEQMVSNLPIQEFIITNTVCYPSENKKIRIVSIAKLLAEIIPLLSENKSLYDYRGEREMLNYAYLQKIREINREKHQKTNEHRPEPY